MNLKKILDKISINADWIGLREVKEVATYRVIRDNNPASNHRDQSHGIMVEVLKNGQFGPKIKEGRNITDCLKLA